MQDDNRAALRTAVEPFQRPIAARAYRQIFSSLGLYIATLALMYWVSSPLLLADARACVSRVRISGADLHRTARLRSRVLLRLEAGKRRPGLHMQRGNARTIRELAAPARAAP